MESRLLPKDEGQSSGAGRFRQACAVKPHCDGRPCGIGTQSTCTRAAASSACHETRREADREGRPSVAAHDLDLAAMQLDDRLDNREPEAEGGEQASMELACTPSRRCETGAVHRTDARK